MRRGWTHLQIVLSLTMALGSSGCYSEKPANGVVDMSAVPERVALIVPVEGFTLDFGSQPIDTSVDLVLTLVNTGPTAASSIEPDSAKPLAAPFSIKGGTFPGTDGTCASTLAPEESCTVVLTFSPTMNDAFAGTFYLNYVNGVVKFPLAIELTGTTAASLSFSSGPSHQFSTIEINSSAELTLTLTNAGLVAATQLGELAAAPLAAPFSFKGGAYPGAGGSCSDTLASKASCTLVVEFHPAAAGDYAQTLALSFEDGSGTLASVSSELRGKTSGP